MWPTNKTRGPGGGMADFRRPQDWQTSVVSMATQNGRGVVERGRPRAHSAPEATILGTGQGLGGHGAHISGLCRPPLPPPPPPPPPSTKGPPEGTGSTCLLSSGGSPHPAIRSMHNGLATSVPQNITRLDQESGGSPTTAGRLSGGGTGGGVSPGLGGAGGGGVVLQGSTRRAARRRQFSVQSRRENLEMKCCRINVLLVIMQLSLGAVVTALGFYMQTLSPSISVRECPFWAGIPLLLAGVVGIYYCATDFVAYARSVKAFVVKCVCFTLSSACVFVCMIGSVFPGIHGSRISSYVGDCTLKASRHCQCVLSLDPGAKVYEYRDVKSCDLVKTSVKDYLILQCALNAIASGVCFWFVTLLWKSRYQDFYSGIRFQSYTGAQQSQT